MGSLLAIVMLPTKLPRLERYPLSIEADPWTTFETLIKSSSSTSIHFLKIREA